MLIADSCCPQHDPAAFRCEILDRVKLLRPYMEAPLVSAYVDKLIDEAAVLRADIIELCSAFDVETATGQTLTLIGENAGWPRCHCNVRIKPYFGFSCGSNPCVVAGGVSGFKLGPFICEGPIPREDYCFEDDELYRGFIKAFARKAQSNGTVDDINASIRDLWGEDASVIDANYGTVLIGTGRVLTGEEVTLGELYRQVIPVANGMGLIILETLGAGCPDIYLNSDGSLSIIGNNIRRVL